MEALASSRVGNAFHVRRGGVGGVPGLHRVRVALPAVASVLNGLQLRSVVHCLDLNRGRDRNLGHLRCSLLVCLLVVLRPTRCSEIFVPGAMFWLLRWLGVLLLVLSVLGLGAAGLLSGCLALVCA